MIESTQSGIKVFICDECGHRWLRDRTHHNCTHPNKLPVRCAGPGQHRKWNAKGIDKSKHRKAVASEARETSVA